MQEKVDAFAEWASKAFQPSRDVLDGSGGEVGERVAYALEYIAAQLGEMCRKMDHFGTGFRASEKDLEEMKDLLRKL